jgi:hypothetical protein
MRSFLALAGLLMITMPADRAAAEYLYPWCALYGGRNGASNCGFVSWEQCRWTVSGVGGFCSLNPFYVAAHPEYMARWDKPAPPPAVHRKKRRHVVR